MKHLIFGLIHVLFITLSVAQSCDIQLTSRGFASSELLEGQSVNFTFGVFNDASSEGSCAYLANSVMVIVSLPSDGLAFHSVAYPELGKGDYFNWTYDSESNTLIGINHTDLDNGDGDKSVTVRLVGTKLPVYNVRRYLAVNVLRNPNGPTFRSNNPSNDNYVASILVRPSSSVYLSDIFAVNHDCNTNELSWTVNDNMGVKAVEIYRSEDDLNFVKMADVSVTNGTGQVTQKYKDESVLKPHDNVSYRIYTILNDGKKEFQKDIVVKNDCKDKELSISLFPNPAIEKTFVTLNASESEEVKELVVTNSLGEVVMKVPVNSVDSPVEVLVNHLTPGIYNVAITGKELQTTKRFIKIE